MTGLPSASRGPVSILVVRIGVQGRLGVQLDPEDARVLIPPRERTASLVKAYGGQVGERWGDGLLAVFGWPLHPEDHAQRACTAALRIHDQLVGRPASFGADRAPLTLRIGIHSAIAVHDSALPTDSPRSAQIALGGAAELTKGLANFTPIGEVYLTRPSCRAICDSALVRCRPLGVYRIDGEWQSIYALNPHPDPVGPAAALPTQLSPPPFYGRERELQWLRKRVRGFARDRVGVLLHVHGEPGIGKSRLIERLKEDANETGDLAWIHVRGSACGLDAAYSTLREVLSGLLSLDEPGTPSDTLDWPTLLDRVESLLPGEGVVVARDLGLILGVPHQGVKVSVDTMAKRIPGVCARVFRAVLLARPVVIVLDDVQWIDAESRAVLGPLTALIGEASLLLLVCLRDPGIPEFESAMLGGDAVPRQDLEVGPLESEHVDALLNEYRPASENRDRLRAKISEAAAGNPGFIRGAITALVDRGVLSKAPGEAGLVVLDPSAPVTAPERMQGAVLAVYRTLEDTQKHILRNASILGRRFGLRLLCALMHEDLRAAERLDLLAKLERDLEPLVECRYLEQWGYSEKRDYEFRSPLIRDAIYGCLLREQRDALHRRAATILEEWSPSSGKTLHSQILSHRAAVDDWAAMEPYLPRGDDRTFETIAGQDMELTYEQAISAYRALDASRLPTVQRAAIERRLGELSMMNHHIRESLDHFKRAAQFLGQPATEMTTGTRGEIVRQLLVQLMHRWFPRTLGKPAATAVNDLERESVRVFDGWIWALYFGDQERMILEILRTLNQGESSGNREKMERGYLLLCYLTTAVGWFSAAERYADLGQQALIPDGQFATSGFADNLLGVHNVMRGDLAVGERHLHEAIRGARETGAYVIFSSACACLSLALQISGNLAAAFRAGKEMVVVGRTMAFPGLVHWGLGIQGGALLRSGRLPEAEELLRSTLDLARDLPDLEALARFTGDLVCCLLRQGQTVAAKELLDRAEVDPGIARVRGMNATFLRHARLELRIVHATDDGRPVSAHWRQVQRELRLARKETGGFRPAATTTLRLEGTLLWLYGHPKPARDRWYESIRLAQSQGARFEAALGHMEIAERTGDRDAERAGRELATGLALAVDWPPRR